MPSFAQAAAASDWSGSSSRSDYILRSKERSSEDLNCQELEEGKNTLQVLSNPINLQDPHSLYQDDSLLDRKRKLLKSSTPHQQQTDALIERSHMMEVENTGSLALIPAQDFANSLRESAPSALVEFGHIDSEGAKKQKMETSSSFMLTAEAAYDEQPRRAP